MQHPAMMGVAQSPADGVDDGCALLDADGVDRAIRALSVSPAMNFITR